MDESFETPVCPLCGQGNAAVVMRGRGPASLVRCKRDHLVYMSPRLRPAGVREFHKYFVRPDNLDLFAGYRQEILRREATAIQ